MSWLTNIKNKFLDDEGLFQRGKFAPLQKLGNNIRASFAPKQLISPLGSQAPQNRVTYNEPQLPVIEPPKPTFKTQAATNLSNRLDQIKRFGVSTAEKIMDDKGIVRQGQIKPLAPLDDKIKEVASKANQNVINSGGYKKLLRDMSPVGMLDINTKNVQAFNPYVNQFVDNQDQRDKDIDNFKINNTFKKLLKTGTRTGTNLLDQANQIGTNASDAYRDMFYNTDGNKNPIKNTAKILKSGAGAYALVTGKSTIPSLINADSGSNLTKGFTAGMSNVITGTEQRENNGGDTIGGKVGRFIGGIAGWKFNPINKEVGILLDSKIPYKNIIDSNGKIITKAWTPIKNKFKNYIVTRGSRGMIEDLVDNLSRIQDDASDAQNTVGFIRDELMGAVSEIISEKMFDIGKKGVDKLWNGGLGKSITDIFKTKPDIKPTIDGNFKGNKPLTIEPDLPMSKDGILPSGEFVPNPVNPSGKIRTDALDPVTGLPRGTNNSNFNQMAGGIAGFEPYQDEEGNWKLRYNPEKGALGIAVMGGMNSSSGKQLLDNFKLSEEDNILQKKTPQELMELVDGLRKQRFGDKQITSMLRNAGVDTSALNLKSDVSSIDSILSNRETELGKAGDITGLGAEDSRPLPPKPKPFVDYKKQDTEILKSAAKQEAPDTSKSDFNARQIENDIKGQPQPNIGGVSTPQNKLYSIAEEFDNPEDFIAHYRGSATQYNKYTPELRKYGTTENSTRISDLGIDPNRKITIYRGIDDVENKVRNPKINDGDFVTTDKDSAGSYTGGTIVSKEVRAKDLITDFPDEFDVKDPFYTGAEFIYSDSKNKLIKYTDNDLRNIFDQSKKLGLNKIKQNSAEASKSLAYKNQYGFFKMGDKLVNDIETKIKSSYPEDYFTGNNYNKLGELITKELDNIVSPLKPQIQQDFQLPELVNKNGKNFTMERAPNAPISPLETFKAVYTPSTNLSPEEKIEETKFFNEISQDIDGYMKKYFDTFDNELNTDNVRELSTYYLEDKARSSTIHEPSSAFTKVLYDYMLNKPVPDGKKATTFFTAGGAGSGKTSAIDTVDSVKNISKSANIVYDSNLSNTAGAIEKIDQSLKTGRNVYISYVYSDPIKAFNNAIGRAIKKGRTVRIDDFIKTHEKSYQTIYELAQHYKDNKKVIIDIIDNTGDVGKAFLADLEKISGKEYNIDELRRTFYDTIKQKYQSGEISRKLYQGFYGRPEAKNVRVGEGSSRIQENDTSKSQQQERTGINETLASKVTTPPEIVNPKTSSEVTKPKIEEILSPEHQKIVDKNKIEMDKFLKGEYGKGTETKVDYKMKGFDARQRYINMDVNKIKDTQLRARVKEALSREAWANDNKIKNAGNSIDQLWAGVAKIEDSIKSQKFTPAKSEIPFKKKTIPDNDYSAFDQKPPEGNNPPKKDFDPTKDKQKTEKVVLTDEEVSTKDTTIKERLTKWAGKVKQGKAIATTQAKEFSDIPSTLRDEIITAREKTNKTASTEAQKYAGKFGQVFDALHKIATKYGVNTEFRKDYFTHLWKTDSDGNLIKSGRSVSSKPYFTKKQQITWQEGLDMGLEPRFKTAQEALEAYSTALYKSIANKQLIDGLKKDGLAFDEQVGYQFKPVSVAGYRNSLDDSNILYLPKKSAEMFEKVFNPKQAEAWWEKGLEATAKFGKGATQTVLSGGYRAVNAMGIGKLFFKELPSGNFNAFRRFGQAMTNSGAEKLYKDIEPDIKWLQGLGVDISAGKQNVSDYISNPNYGRGVGEKIKKAFKDNMESPTFDYFIPATQVDFARSIRKAGIKQGFSTDEVNKAVVGAMKQHYDVGNSLDSMLKNKNLNNLLDSLFFAKTLRKSTFMSNGVNTVKSLFDPTALKNRGNIKQVVGSVISLALLNEVNKASTGNNMWENPDGWQYAYIKYGKDKEGNDKYIRLNTTNIEYTWLTQGLKLIGSIGDNKKFASAAKAPLQFGVGQLVDLMSNTDYKMDKIWQGSDTADVKAKKITDYLVTEFSHPIVKNVKTFLDKPDDEQKVEKLLGGLSESPIAFKTSKTYSNAQYYKSVDEVTSNLSEEDKKIYESITKKQTEFGAKQRDKVADAQMLVNYPEVMKAQKEIAIINAKKTKTKLDPLYELSDDQLKTFYQIQGLGNNRDAQKTLKEENQWYSDLSEARGEHFKELISSGKMKEQENDYPQAKPETQKKLDYLKELKTPEIKKKQDYYYTLPKGTGARTAYLKANPDLKKYWETKNAFEDANPDIQEYWDEVNGYYVKVDEAFGILPTDEESGGGGWQNWGNSKKKSDYEKLQDSLWDIKKKDRALSNKLSKKIADILNEKPASDTKTKTIGSFFKSDKLSATRKIPLTAKVNRVKRKSY